MYIYIHTYTYTHIHIYIYTYIDSTHVSRREEGQHNSRVNHGGGGGGKHYIAQWYER